MAYLKLFFGNRQPAQTLLPALVASDDAFLVPTVSSSYPLTAGLYTDTETFFAPSVTSAITLTPDLFADTDAFYAPTATVGAVTLLPSLVTDTDIYFVPTVAVATALSPGLVTDSEVFFAPAVTTSVSLAASLYSDTDTFYIPSVVAAATLAAALFTDTETFFAPTVSAGAVTLLPSLVADIDIFYSPTVVLAQSLAPSLFVDGELFYAPTVTTSASVLPGLISDTDTFHAPVVAAGPFIVFPDNRVIDLEIFYSPSVTTTAFIVFGLFVDPFEFFLSPQVSLALSPSRVVDADAFFAPGVGGGTINISPPLLAFPDVFYVPTVLREKVQGGGGGGVGGGVPPDIKYASQMVMASSGLITKTGVVAERNLVSNTRMMIYADAAATPGALVAQSVVKGAVLAGTNLYSLLVPYAVLVGQTIWIALHSDGDFKWFLTNQHNGSRFNNDVFADGPSNPFGVASIDNKQAPVFAVILESANASVLPDRLIDLDVFFAPVGTNVETMTTSFVIYDDAIWPPAVLTINAVDVSYLGSDDSLPAPTVTAGTMELLPLLVVDDDLFYGANVGQTVFPDQDVFSALMPPDDVIYPSEVTPVGGDTLAPFVVDDDAIYLPEVSNFLEVFVEEHNDNDQIYSPDVLSSIEWPFDLYLDQDVIEPPEVTVQAQGQEISPPLVPDDDQIVPVSRVGRELRFAATIRGLRTTKADVFGGADKSVALSGTATRRGADIRGSEDKSVDVLGTVTKTVEVEGAD